MPPGGSKRPGLTRDAVVAAAVALADESGVGDLSMRRLATRVGVEAMSLYHHVPNKDALLSGMVDAVFAEIYRPVPGRPWRAELRARSVAAREVLLRHRWAVGLMDANREPGPATLEHHDAVIGCLREDGFSWSLTASAFAVLDAHLYGFLLQELALPFHDEAELEAIADGIAAAIPDGSLPYFTAFTTAVALQPGYSFGAEFAVGLDLVLDGLERQWEAERNST